MFEVRSSRHRRGNPRADAVPSANRVSWARDRKAWDIDGRRASGQEQLDPRLAACQKDGPARTAANRFDVLSFEAAGNLESVYTPRDRETPTNAPSGLRLHAGQPPELGQIEHGFGPKLENGLRESAHRARRAQGGSAGADERFLDVEAVAAQCGGNTQRFDRLGATPIAEGGGFTGFEPKAACRIDDGGSPNRESASWNGAGSGL